MMKKELWEHNYFNSYYYSNIITNILSGDIEFIGFTSEFFTENYEFLKPFRKYSAFHQFIQHIIWCFLNEDMQKYDEAVFERFKSSGIMQKLYLEEILDNYSLSYSFEEFNLDNVAITYELIEAYHEDLILSGYQEELIEKIAHEVFYILFNNRLLLIQFNLIVAQYVSELGKDSFDVDDEDEIAFRKYYKSFGTLKRVEIPAWVKKTVFFREQGRCCLCGTDLSGTLRPNDIQHYDHMVPLFQGGINDVSNVQLLCSKCNLSKGKKDITTSSYYFKWY